MSNASRFKVLVVDDEPDLLSSICKNLQKDYSVTAVETGEMALYAAEQEMFPVVILDLCLPGMSGLETLGALRKLNARINAIILTASTCRKSTIECINHRVFRYLNKPFSPAKLRAFVREGIEEFHTNNQSLTSRISSPNQLRKFDLTARQADVAFWITKGMNNAEIASEMGISIRGVEKHVEAIFKKFDVANRTRMTAKVHEWVNRLAR